MAAQPDSGLSPRLSLPDLLAFSTPGVCVGALSVALSVFLPHYYAGHFGLGLPVVGLAFMAVRLADTLLDPFIGIAMDKTRTRFGAYRPWLLAGAPVLMLSVFMLFDPPGAVSTVYLVGWLFIYYVGTSLILLSHVSWASKIAAAYNERSRVFGAIQMVSIIGAVIVLVLPVAMANKDGSSGSGAVGAMGWFVIVSAAAGVLLAVSRIPERANRRADEARVTLRDYWRMVSRSDMRRIIVAEFCLTMGPGWMAALYLFYFHDTRGFTLKDSSILLLIYVAAGVVGAAALSFVATRLGKHRTLMLCATGYSLGLIGQSFLPKGDLPPAAAVMFVMGFLASSFILLDRAMVADVADANRLEQGRDRVGLLYAMLTTMQKIAGALSIGLSFTVLGWIGYQAKEGAHNTTAAIQGMQMVYLIGPVSFVMLGGACFIGYTLNAARHGEIRTALDARDALETEAPAPSGLTGDSGTPARFAALPERGLPART